MQHQYSNNNRNQWIRMCIHRYTAAESSFSCIHIYMRFAWWLFFYCSRSIALLCNAFLRGSMWCVLCGVHSALCMRLLHKINCIFSFENAKNVARVLHPNKPRCNRDSIQWVHQYWLICQLDSLASFRDCDRCICRCRRCCVVAVVVLLCIISFVFFFSFLCLQCLLNRAPFRDNSSRWLNQIMFSFKYDLCNSYRLGSVLLCSID